MIKYPKKKGTVKLSGEEMNLQEFDKFIENKKFFTEDFEKKLRKRFENEVVFKNGNYFAILTKDFSILIETFENKFDESLMIKEVRSYVRQEKMELFLKYLITKEVKRYARQKNKNIFPFTDEDKKNTSIWPPDEK